MADYTNVAFRTLAKEYGASLTYTELISCKSIIHKNKKTKKMLGVSEKEKPVFLQLFGNSPNDFSKAIRIVEKNYPKNFVGYDLNAGCSVPKAIKGKYGSYLMNFPKLVGEIISEMSVFEKPVSIKMRLGFGEENFLEVAEQAIANGVNAITLHPRFGKQLYSGKADWEKIKELRKNTPKKIRIIGNGDVNNVEDYCEMKKTTSCDFVMIGRASMGNAFLFKQIKKFEEKKPILERTKNEYYEEGKRYLELAKKFDLKANDVRPYFISFAKSIPGAKKIRNDFALSKTINEIEVVLENNLV